jgi:hypothetical protein
MGHSALGDAQKPATCKPCSVLVSSVVRLYAHSRDMIGTCITNPMLCYSKSESIQLLTHYETLLTHYETLSKENVWIPHRSIVQLFEGGISWRFLKDSCGFLKDSGFPVIRTFSVHYAQKPGTCKPCSVVRLQHYCDIIGTLWDNSELPICRYKPCCSILGHYEDIIGTLLGHDTRIPDTNLVVRLFKTVIFLKSHTFSFFLSWRPFMRHKAMKTQVEQNYKIVDGKKVDSGRARTPRNR